MKRMMAVKKGRRVVACILAASLCLTSAFVGVVREGAEQAALAAEQLSGDAVWEYETSSGTVTITGYKGTDTQIHIPETLQDSEGDSLAVTKIASNAFKDCTELTSVEIPKSVTEIGTGIFSGCSNIREITVSEENEYYDSREACNAIIQTKIKKLVAGCQTSRIPDDVEMIGKNAFDGCAGLESIHIPSTVYWIDEYAFCNCSDLQQIDFAEGSSIFKIAGFAFCGCKKLESISLPPNITEVQRYMFDGCSSLERIEVPEGVTAFGDRAFSDCSSLRELNFPESLTSIGNSTFSGCASLPAVRIPSGMTELGTGLFRGCESLTEIEIPSGIKKIGDMAFSSCTGLTEIEIPEGVTEMGEWVFSECDSLTRVDLPDGITSIPKFTFYSCDKLAEVGFPGALTEIEEGAFKGCKGLTKLEIPEGVTKLGENAFYRASNFKEIKLPDTLKSIGDEAFLGTSLESLTIPKNVSAIGSGLFNGQDDSPNDLFTSIRQITVDEENETFDSRDGSNAIIKTETDTLLYGSNTTTKIPEGVKKIAKYAFSGCKDLESIEISSTVNSIEGHIFTKCNGLSKITVSKGNSTYESRDGCNAVLQGSKLVVGCKATKIPSDVRSLEKAAFSGCTALTEIELPSGLREIPDMAFLACSSLKSIKIPYGVTAIKTYAFNYCTSLESVYIPDTVTTFDGFGSKMVNVFIGCNKLTIYTTEGAKAVEFAKEFKIPYSFEAMPGESKSPQETLTPTPQPPKNPGDGSEGSSGTQTGNTGTGSQKSDKEVGKDKGNTIPKVAKVSRFKGKIKTKKKKKTLELTWKKVSGISGYQIQFSTKKSFKGAKKISIKKSKTKYKISKLKAGKKYYVRIRAYKVYKTQKGKKKKAYGKWVVKTAGQRSK